ncbi:type I-E CRISPR-associated protein Cse2/CasB [Bombella sp. ESL0385]|uniref:type I-E CRISPR-associated protein Cse2/CasB n=1 Tax=Bombella sp. ESL0385 TaxID=2676446 RepID=UPI0012D8CA49|nr:type I-E CRISPR-associated protein Cse2/CasB [Bombella sp. ESL0385]MUG90913.1 type I-E CRISPR-associated protein Cse2/CasB [Bombella sp. ESL0385]
MSEKRSIGEEIFQWWRNYIAPRVQGQSEDEAEGKAQKAGSRDARQSAARALSARLRRSTYPDILFEPTVSRLVVTLGLGEHQLKPFAQTLHVISFVRHNVPDSLAKRLKGADETPVMSHMRFKQLITAERDEVASLLRRAVTSADEKCNVARLAGDMMFWGDQTRTRWCLDYFGVPFDSEKKAEPSQA